MNEIHEVEISGVEASFIASPFTLVLGVEKEHVLQVLGNDRLDGFTEVEWQVVYARVLVDDRWFFMPQDLYDEVDELYGDRIGDELWKLTRLM